MKLGLVLITEFHQVPNRLRSEKIAWDAENGHIRLRSPFLGSSLYRVKAQGYTPIVKSAEKELRLHEQYRGKSVKTRY